MTLPACVEDLILGFAFKRLTLDEVLATMPEIIATNCFQRNAEPFRPRKVIPDKTKEKFNMLVSGAYKQAFGRTATKYSLDFWKDIEFEIQFSCGDEPRQFQFFYIYSFLENMVSSK